MRNSAIAISAPGSRERGGPVGRAEGAVCPQRGRQGRRAKAPARASVIASLFVLACGAPACPEPPATDTAGDEVARAPSPPAEVRRLEDAPQRSAPPGTATIALLAQGNNAFVGRLEMEPNAAVPEHQDADEEYIVVLQGHGTIRIDGVEHAVTPGSTIFMPAGATVSFQNGDERLIAIQVFAGPASAAKYDRWTPVEGSRGEPQ